MAIDFSRLDISLDKFNAESSGTYNIGHLKLSSDGTSVYRNDFMLDDSKITCTSTYKLTIN